MPRCCAAARKAKMLAHLRHRANKAFDEKTCKVVRIGNGACAHVTPATNHGNVTYLCNLDTKSCGCNFPDFTGFPCIEMAILSRSLGRLDRLEELVQDQDRTPFWQAQYDFDFTRCIPSSADVWLATTSNLERPKKSRHRSSLEGRSAHAPGQDKQLRKVYICKKCGKQKKGHICAGAPQG